MAPFCQGTESTLSQAKLEKRPIVTDRPPIPRDHFLSDCLAIIVSLIALVALFLLLG